MLKRNCVQCRHAVGGWWTAKERSRKRERQKTGPQKFDRIKKKFCCKNTEELYDRNQIRKDRGKKLKQKKSASQDDGGGWGLTWSVRGISWSDRDTEWVNTCRQSPTPSSIASAKISRSRRYHWVFKKPPWGVGVSNGEGGIFCPPFPLASPQWCPPLQGGGGGGVMVCSSALTAFKSPRVAVYWEGVQLLLWIGLELLLLLDHLIWKYSAHSQMTSPPRVFTNFFFVFH